MKEPPTPWQILLVDDDEDDYHLTRSMLAEVQDRRVNLEWAQNYQDGLQFIQRAVTAYDAVLVDYDLGTHSGIMWIREALASGCPSPIILYTGRGSHAVDVEGMEAGASLYLTKFEATPLLLERAIRYAIERKQSERQLAEANRRLALQNADLEMRVAERMAQVERAAAELEERNLALAHANAQLIQANAELVERENLLNQVLDSLPVGVCLVDRVGRIVRGNSEAQRIWGGNLQLAPGEFHRLRGWWSSTGQELLPHQWAAARVPLDGQPVLDEEIDILAFDGQRRSIWSSAVPLRDASGVLNGAVVVNRDITQVRQTQADLHRAYILLDHVFENLYLGIALLDCDLNFVRVNTNYAHMDGREPAFFVGKNHFSLYPDSANEAIFRQVLSTGQPYVTQNRAFVYVDHPERGVTYWDWTLHPILDERAQVSGLLLTLLDVTQRRRAEDELKARVRDQAADAQRSAVQAAQLETILESMMDAVLVVYPERVGRANALAHQLAGIEIENHLRSDLLQAIVFTTLDGQPVLPDQLPASRALRGETVRDVPLVLTSLLDGRRLSILSSATPLVENKQVTGAVVVFREAAFPETRQKAGEQAELLQSREQLAHVREELLRLRQEYQRTEADLVEVAQELLQREFQLRASVANLQHSETRLHTTERQLHAVLEHLPIGVWVINEHGEIIYGNPAGQKIWGGAEYVGQEDYNRYRGWWYTTGQEILPEEWAGLRAVNRGETSLDKILEIECFDGQHKIIRNSAVPLRGEEGQVQGAVVLNEDITEMIHIQQELNEHRDQLHASELYWRAIFDLSVVGQISVDPLTYRLLAANQRMAEITGYGVDELKGMNFMDLTHPDDRAEDQRRFDRMLAGEDREYASRKRCTRKNGAVRWVEVHARLIRDLRGMPDRTAAVVLDITDEIEAQEATRGYLEQLARSNRELEQFAFVASHDLQEPVRKIESFTALLMSNSSSLSEGDREYLERIKGASSRMHRMINDLLALSRVSTHSQPYVWVELNEVMGMVIDDLEMRIAQANGQVIVEDLPALMADPVQMRMLFQNLVSNGLKFHREGVPPVVKLRGERGEEGRVLIHVQDNGIGFDMKYLERIFQPFMRLNERWRYEGTGMGLAICKKIVERHGGEITAEGWPGEGAVFTVTLPQKPV